MFKPSHTFLPILWALFFVLGTYYLNEHSLAKDAAAPVDIVAEASSK